MTKNALGHDQKTLVAKLSKRIFQQFDLTIFLIAQFGD
jgi:hypothetical protein